MRIFITFLLVLISAPLFALDRCEEYRIDVRIQHTLQFGLSFPWANGLGQLQQESNCRANSTAFDLGQGIAQFMPKTAQYINSLMGEALNPYNPQQAIRMQAFYMSRIHRLENFALDKLATKTVTQVQKVDKEKGFIVWFLGFFKKEPDQIQITTSHTINNYLFIDYQIYNGGAGNLKNEYKRAGAIDWQKMKDQCQRKKIKLKSGQILDFCQVNYDYSVKVNKYGKQYGEVENMDWRFW